MLWGQTGHGRQGGPMGIDGTVEERIEMALAELRPVLERDGGDIRLVSIEDGVVTVELLGACSSCPMAHNTLRDFVSERILLYAPEIEAVRST